MLLLLEPLGLSPEPQSCPELLIRINGRPYTTGSQMRACRILVEPGQIKCSRAAETLW